LRYCSDELDGGFSIVGWELDVWEVGDVDGFFCQTLCARKKFLSKTRELNRLGKDGRLVFFDLFERAKAPPELLEAPLPPFVDFFLELPFERPASSFLGR